MKNIATLIGILYTILLASCAEEDYKYVYLDGDNSEYYEIIHLDKDCNSKPFYLPISDLEYRRGTWYVYYSHGYTDDVRFCAKCISPRQMDRLKELCSKDKNDTQQNKD